MSETSTTSPENVAKQAPTEQQNSSSGAPKRFAVGQTVCNEKNEKGKLCNGHLKQRVTAHPSAVHLRGDDVLHQCQTCGALYMGPPQGHVRDSRKQTRYVERDLAAILNAAGGTLPAYDYPIPEWRRPAPSTARATTKAAPPSAAAVEVSKPAAPAATAPGSPVATASATVAPEGETPAEKRARVLAEFKAKNAAKMVPVKKKVEGEVAPAAEGSASAIVDSSAEADRHRPAAEAQAETGQASAAPLSPAAATASPKAGAETVADLATEASTELTPGAPKAEEPVAEQKPAKREAGARRKGPLPLPPHLQPPPGETHEEKIARLTAFVEEAKRKAGK